MDGKCKTMDTVYDCCVTSHEPQWKNRYYNHKKSFSYKRYSHETTLSSYVWYLKETLDVTPDLKLSLVR